MPSCAAFAAPWIASRQTGFPPCRALASCLALACPSRHHSSLRCPYAFPVAAGPVAGSRRPLHQVLPSALHASLSQALDCIQSNKRESETVAKQITIEHVFKVFGDAPQDALALVQQGLSKSDILAALMIFLSPWLTFALCRDCRPRVLHVTDWSAQNRAPWSSMAFNPSVMPPSSRTDTIAHPISRPHTPWTPPHPPASQRLPK